MDKKYSIVYCINTLTGGGGTARVVALKASYFTDILGCKVDVIVSRQDGKPIDYQFSDKVTIHFMDEALSVSYPPIPVVGFVYYLKNARKEYYEKIKEINPDFVTVVGPFFEDLIIPSICDKLKIRSIREFHSSRRAYLSLALLIKGVKGRLIFNIQKYLTFRQFNRYDCVVTLTNADRKDSNYTTRTEVIPNMSDLNIVNCEPALNSKRVISVGSMRNNGKRFDMQIRLWKEFIRSHPDWTLHIYGDGVEMKRLLDLVAEIGLEKSVFLYGSAIDIAQKYLESSIYLSTSIAEGFGLTISEAAEAGLPAISIDCPCGPSDIIIEGETGFLIKEGDTRTLLEKLKYLADNPEIRAAMSVKAKKESRRYFIDVIALRWIALYESLIKK